MRSSEERAKIGEFYNVFDESGNIVAKIPRTDVSFTCICHRPVLVLRNKNQVKNQFAFGSENSIKFFVQILNNSLRKLFDGYYAKQVKSFEDWLAEIVTDAEVAVGLENHKEYSIRFVQIKNGKVEAHITFGWSKKIVIKSLAYEIML